MTVPSRLSRVADLAIGITALAVAHVAGFCRDVLALRDWVRPAPGTAHGGARG